MIEYTNVEVSKRLVQAGFDKMPGADIDGWHVLGNDNPVTADRNVPMPRIDQYGSVVMERYPGYRADTLLSWLMARCHGNYLFRLWGSFDVEVWKNGEPWVRASATTLPDVYAEIILKVLAIATIESPEVEEGSDA